MFYSDGTVGFRDAMPLSNPYVWLVQEGQVCFLSKISTSIDWIVPHVAAVQEAYKSYLVDLILEE